MAFTPRERAMIAQYERTREQWRMVVDRVSAEHGGQVDPLLLSGDDELVTLTMQLETMENQLPDARLYE